MAYNKNYKELKRADGTYSKKGFIARAFQLWSIQSFKRFKHKYFPNCNFLWSIRLFFDAVWCSIRYGAIYDDYFEYRLWEKSHYARNLYVTKGRSRKIQGIFNSSGNAEFTYNKQLFNKEYARFRTVKDYTFPGDIESFKKFVQDSNYKIIAKPKFGSSGQGIFVPDVTTDAQIADVYAKLSNDNAYFCEEFFRQTGPLGEVNPTSVNTLRLVTLNDSKDIHIMAAFVRFGGKGAVVDNFHSSGFGCEVDINSGIIVSGGIDIDGNKIYFHPASNKLVLGIQIPQWDKVLNLVKEAAMVHPEIGFTGWDFAISENQICIIEANEQPNFGIQARIGHGVLPEYEKIIKLRKVYLSTK